MFHMSHLLCLNATNTSVSHVSYVMLEATNTSVSHASSACTVEQSLSEQKLLMFPFTYLLRLANLFKFPVGWLLTHDLVQPICDCVVEWDVWAGKDD